MSKRKRKVSVPKGFGKKTIIAILSVVILTGTVSWYGFNYGLPSLPDNGDGQPLTPPILSNALDYIHSESPYADDFVIHPDVIKFSSGIKLDLTTTYTFVMAMTPFYANDQVENPCVVVSTSATGPYVSDNIINPLTPAPSDGHNCDTDIVYVNGRFYVYYNAGKTLQNARMCVKISAQNSLTSWGSEQRLTGIVDYCLSPAIVYDGTWHLWGVQLANNVVPYYQSTDGTNWALVSYTNMSLTNVNRYPWHIDVEKTTGGKYFTLITCGGTQSGGEPRENYFGMSTDGIHWTMFTEEPALKPSQNDWDLSVYRASFIIEQQTLKVWYCAMKTDYYYSWHIGYTETSIASFVKFGETTLNIH